MTPERLAQLLAVYGARAERWPATERQAALELFTDQGADFRQATALDAALDRFAVPHPNSAMVGTALAGFVAMAPRSLLRRWWLAPLLASAGALGMAAGAMLPSFTPAERQAGWFDENPSIFSAAPGDAVDPEEVSL